MLNHIALLGVSINLDQTIETMPLFASDRALVVAAEPDLFTVHRWIPCDNVSQAMVVLDHELIGDVVIGAAQAMLVGGEIAPLAIYSVGFDTVFFGDLYRKRAEHLTMDTVDLKALGIEKTGSGPKLLSFLEKRLLPMIARELPHLDVPPALAGFSLSGLFALQAATNFPHLFGDISAFSPSLFLDREVQAGLATLLSQDPSRRLYLAAGKLEEDRAQTGLDHHMHELVAELGARLQADYGDRVIARILESETHFSVPFSTVPAMLRHLFSPIALS